LPAGALDLAFFARDDADVTTIATTNKLNVAIFSACLFTGLMGCVYF
jgi:hypothetical protein